MKTVKLIVLFVLLCVFSFSCDKEADSEEEKDYPVEIPFTLITQGAGSVVEDLTNVNFVIKNKSDWNVLINKMENTYSSVTFSEKNIDFSKYQVIALFDKQYGNGGWSIDVTKVMEYSNKIVVSVDNLETGNLASVITTPYQVVKIPYSRKKIEFEKK